MKVKVEFKNIREYEYRRGLFCNADVYANGIQIGDYEDDGVSCGSPFIPCHQDVIDVKALEKTIRKNLVKKMEEINYIEMIKDETAKLGYSVSLKDFETPFNVWNDYYCYYMDLKFHKKLTTKAITFEMED